MGPGDSNRDSLTVSFGGRLAHWAANPVQPGDPGEARRTISENNGTKALEMQLAWTASSRLSLTCDNLPGDETGSRLRFFNDALVKYELGGGFAVAAAYDVGRQQSISHAITQVWPGVFGAASGAAFGAASISGAPARASR